MNKTKLKNQKENFLKSLSKDDMKAYIDELIKKYYNNYLKGEIKETNKVIDEINNLISFLEDNSYYSNIRNYVNYRIIIINNKALSSILNRGENILFTPKTVLIDESSIENNKDMFDEDLMNQIIMQEYFQDIYDFIEFIDNVEDFTIPESIAKKIKEFIIDVKDGNYDRFIEIKEDSLHNIVK